MTTPLTNSRKAPALGFWLPPLAIAILVTGIIIGVTNHLIYPIIIGGILYAAANIYMGLLMWRDRYRLTIRGWFEWALFGSPTMACLMLLACLGSGVSGGDLFDGPTVNPIVFQPWIGALWRKSVRKIS